METKGKLEIVAAVCVLLACLAASAPAKVIYVDADATGANDGSSWTNAFTSLHNALSAARPTSALRRGHIPSTPPSATEIRVAQGVYRPYQVGLRSVPSAEVFYLTGGLMVKGGYAGVGAADPNERSVETYRTILSGDLNGDDVDGTCPGDLLGQPTRADNSRHIVCCYGSDANTILDGFIITGATDGALELPDGRLSVQDCLFTGNAAISDGGAVHSQRGEILLTRCRFVGNWAARFGGAICADSRGTLTLVDCRFTDNGASNGAATASEEIDVQMTGCTFEGNVAEGQGAVHCMGGTLQMDRCTFLGNSSPLSPLGRGDGGAIGVFGAGDATIIGCRFEKNSAYAGGAVWSDCNVALRECVFSGNSARRGGAIFGLYGSAISNCIFAGNRARWGGAAESDCIGPEFRNCTFVANRADDGNAVSRSSCHGLPEHPIIMTNCILWDGGNEIGIARNTYPIRYLKTDITFSDVWGGWPGEGNLNADPYFADPGRWDPNGTPEDPGDDVWISGDYHLKSPAGRWDPVKADWVLDDVTSPCIDAGHPVRPFVNEPEPNGDRIDMGAYGGTTEASKSPVR